MTLKPETQELCLELTVEKIDQVVAVHLQQGPLRTQGPIVVPLPEVKDGKASGCRKLDQPRFTAVSERPADYFVNVRTTRYPGGAIRGQLAAPTPGPASTLPGGVTVPPRTP